MTDGRQMVSIAIEYITHLPDLIHPVKWQLQINKKRSIALLSIISCIATANPSSFLVKDVHM